MIAYCKQPDTNTLYWDSLVAIQPQFVEEEQPKNVKKKRHPMAPLYGTYREPFTIRRVFIRPEYHARSNPRGGR